MRCSWKIVCAALRLERLEPALRVRKRQPHDHARHHVEAAPERTADTAADGSSARLVSSHREPIATSAPSRIAANKRSASAIGEERSASVNITMLPARVQQSRCARCSPCRDWCRSGAAARAGPSPQTIRRSPRYCRVEPSFTTSTSASQCCSSSVRSTSVSARSNAGAFVVSRNHDAVLRSHVSLNRFIFPNKPLPY